MIRFMCRVAGGCGRWTVWCAGCRAVRCAQYYLLWHVQRTASHAVLLLRTGYCYRILAPGPTPVAQ